VVVGTTKTHQRRSVPIPRFLADELADHLAGKAPGDLVFTAPEGGVLRNTNFRPRFFDPAAEKAGLPGLTPHELRHTAASLAVAAGANVKAVQQMLGHASAAMTLDVYAGLFADDLDAVAEARPRVRETECGPYADQTAPGPVQPSGSAP
jgi:integrase